MPNTTSCGEPNKPQTESGTEATYIQRRGSAVIRRLSVAHASLQASVPNEVLELLSEVPVLEKYRRHRAVLSRKKQLAGKPEPTTRPSRLCPRPHKYWLKFMPIVTSLRRDGSSVASQPPQPLSQPTDLERGRTAGASSSDEEDSGQDSDEDDDSNLSTFSWCQEQLEDFSDVYLFGSPLLFYRAAELAMMFHCLYLALWMTDFAVLTSQIEQPDNWAVITQLAM